MKTLPLWYRVCWYILLLLVTAEVVAASVYGLARERFPASESVMPPAFALTHLLPIGSGKAYHGAGGLNDRGQAVGATMIAGGTLRATLWAAGTASDLGTLGGPNSIARATNNSGQIVGGAATPAGMHAFLWEDGRMRDLGTLPGFTQSIATGINENGEVIGRAYNASSKPYWTWPTIPFLWRQGRMTALPLPGRCFRAQAAAINDQGVIVGWGTDAVNNTIACYWKNGKAISLAETLGRKQSSAVAINHRGQVAGTAGNSERDMRAFVWQNGKVQWLPMLPYQTRARAAAIGEDGTVYCEARIGGENLPALVWHPGQAAPQDSIDCLPKDAEFFPGFVFGVNKRGQVLAFGYFARQPDQLALLTPTKGVP